MSRQITCQNEDGLSVVFGDTFQPWLLEDCTGIYTSDINVARTENTIIDGSEYFGSTIRERNIVLTLRDRPDGSTTHKENRALLYTLFRPKTTGTLIYSENDEHYKINYYVEMIDSEGANRSRQVTVSLICPDPYFTAINDITVEMANWNALWTFPHQFQEGGEPFATRSLERIVTIINENAVDDIGLTITITAVGTVLNPSITDISTSESMHIGTAEYPFEMVIDDEVIISTETRNKHIYLVRDGVQTEINEYLSEDSVFLQLAAGTNSFGYDADEGADNMVIYISYSNRYMGV